MAFADLVVAADRAALAHLGGVMVTYQPEAEAAVEVQGLFEAEGVLIDQGEAGTELLGPSVFLCLSDLPTDPDEDDPTLTILGREYRIRERRRDGLGGVRLFLHRAE